MNPCPGYRKALETHIPSLDPLAATAVHVRISLASQRRITSHSQSRRSIPQAPTRDEHQWQHTTSKPALPHLEARWQRTTSKPAIPHLDARFHVEPSDRSQIRSDCLKAGPRVWTLIDAYFNPAMRDKATTWSSVAVACSCSKNPVNTSNPIKDLAHHDIPHVNNCGREFSGIIPPATIRAEWERPGGRE